MHRDHNVFVQSLENGKKVLLTYFNDKQGRYKSCTCTPVEFNQGGVLAGKIAGSSIYVFSENHKTVPLLLSKDQILKMKPTEIIFDQVRFRKSSQRVT